MRDKKFPSRLFGILAIVAGVFIVLGGGCIFLIEMSLGGGPVTGALGLLVGIGLIVVGVKMVRDSNDKSE